RSWTVCGRRAVHRERRIVAGLPDHLAGVHIEGRHDFALTLSRELIDAIADDERRRISGADLDLPLLSQLFGPRFRIGWSRRRAVAIRSTPLVPIVGSTLLCLERQD